MATLAELAVLYGKGTSDIDLFVEKIKSAVLLAAEAIRLEAPGTTLHTERLIWAKGAFSNPRVRTEELYGAILAANAGFTSAQILGATDTAILTAVNNAVNVFVTLPVTPPV